VSFLRCALHVDVRIVVPNLQKRFFDVNWPSELPALQHPLHGIGGRGRRGREAARLSDLREQSSERPGGGIGRFHGGAGPSLADLVRFLG